MVYRVIDLAEKRNNADRAWDEKFGMPEDGLPGLSKEKRAEWLEGAGDHDERWALFGYLTSMNKDELAELMAIMWIGRGDEDGSKESWNYCVQHAHSLMDGGEAKYIMEKSPLPEYLKNGLSALGL